QTARFDCRTVVRCYYPAFAALLRQQQRNEIMKALFRFVNIFFCYRLKSLLNLRTRWFRRGLRAAVSVTSNCEGGEF
ncbi:hypothetical protein, partial [Paraburkholderia sp. Ac-20347]|uniref:hypothetical protein n=1 Tax=Paraburkholderia sp. Ac-20347 TaxID=2703892 RepID=UPI001981E332